MTAACEDPEDGALDRGPIVEDHRRVESEGHEAEGRRDRIADEVAVPALAFVRSAVGLDDEAVPHDQVDSADAGNGDLGEAGDAEEVQSIPDERFEPAVRIHSREIDQRTDADGYRGLQLFPFAVREESLPQRGFERAEKGLRAGASGDLAQAVDEVDRLEATRCTVAVSVDDDADGRGDRVSVRIDPDVSLRVRPAIEGPESVMSRGAEAGDSTPPSQCLEYGGGGIGEGVHAVPCPKEVTRLDRGTEYGIRHSCVSKGPRPRDSSLGHDGGDGGGKHPIERGGVRPGSGAGSPHLWTPGAGGSRGRRR